MKNLLKTGNSFDIEYQVTNKKTVAGLYPEFEEFQQFPDVFATGFMVGLMEWCCICALKPALEAGEGSLGTLINVTHEAATPPGALVKVHSEVKNIQGRQILWAVEAYDDLDLIGRGEIGRTVVQWDKFHERFGEKIKKISGTT
ncbi:thioesterase family protein [Bartonella sp. LJL80]